MKSLVPAEPQTPRRGDGVAPSGHPTATSLSGIFGGLAFIGGLISFLGWATEAPRLKDWFETGITIKPNTGILLMCVGAGLTFLAAARGGFETMRRRIAGTLGGFAAVVSALTLVEHLTGIDFGIDTVFYDEAPGAAATAAPGRIGPPAATALLLIGGGLLIAAATRPRVEVPGRRLTIRSLIPAFGVGACSLALLALSGYLFGVTTLYAIPLTGIALQTTWMILAAGVGLVLAAPDREPARTTFERSAAGLLVRRALPLVVALPLLLGWVRTKAEEAGYFGPGMGRSLLVLSLVACLSGLLWWAVSGIRAGERLVRRTHDRRAKDLRKMQRLQTVSNHAASADRPEQMTEFVETAVALSEADMGSIQILEGGVLELAASRGLDAPLLELFGSMPLESWNCCLPSDGTKRIAVEDVERSPALAGSSLLKGMLEAGIRALQATPVVDQQGRLMGLLATYYRQPSLPPEADLRMLDLLSRVVGLWIERSRSESERKQIDGVKARLAAIVESSDDAIVSKDLNGIITSWNDAATNLFGYTEEEAVGRPVMILIPPDRKNEEVGILDRLRRGERVEHFETVRRRKDGTLLDISLSISPIFDADGHVVGAAKIARDITERRRNEEALRDSEERFRLLVSVVTDVPWTSDAEGAFTSPQPHWADYTGQTLDRSRGLGWMDAVHPDDRTEMQGVWDRAKKTGNPYQVSTRLWHGRSAQHRHVVARAVPLRNADGTVREWVGTYTDVEEQVRARERLEHLLSERTQELRQSLGRLHDSQRLLALGNLAAGLGHDIANMVLPIRARLEPLAHGCADEEARRDFEAIGQSLTHLTRLSAGLRLMALDPSRNAASTDAVDLRLWWEEAEGVCRALLPRSVTLHADLPPNLGVLMPRHQLTQAVFNLVRNAGEALSATEGGWVRIAATAMTPPQGVPRVALAISDNGPGLSDEARARCFEPYFSTKGRSIATGMGLAMVRGLVESAGGAVTVASEPGLGATFTLSLPSATTTSRSAQTASERVLRRAAISIDDARMAGLAAMMLEGLDIPVSRHAGALEGPVPDADLWVVHEPHPGVIDEFIAADSRRRAIVIQGPSPGRVPPDGAAPRFQGNRRVSVVPQSAPPSVLRDALSAAIDSAAEAAHAGDSPAPWWS